MKINIFVAIAILILVFISGAWLANYINVRADNISAVPKDDNIVVELN